MQTELPCFKPDAHVFLFKQQGSLPCRPMGPDLTRGERSSSQPAAVATVMNGILRSVRMCM